MSWFRDSESVDERYGAAFDGDPGFRQAVDAHYGRHMRAADWFSVPSTEKAAVYDSYYGCGEMGPDVESGGGRFRCTIGLTGRPTARVEGALTTSTVRRVEDVLDTLIDAVDGDVVVVEMTGRVEAAAELEAMITRLERHAGQRGLRLDLRMPGSPEGVTPPRP